MFFLAIQFYMLAGSDRDRDLVPPFSKGISNQKKMFPAPKSLGTVPALICWGPL
jgi:hypothetical protein